MALPSRVHKIDDLTGAGRTAEQMDLLKRAFAGMELRDATFEILVRVKQVDIDDAVHGDPEHCVLARACRRMIDSDVVLFLRGLAYVSMEDEDDIRRVLRFKLAEKTRKTIKKWDEPPHVATPCTLRLLPPNESLKLDVKRALNKKERSKPGYRAKANSRAKKRRVLMRAIGTPVRNINRTAPLGVWRSGTGLIRTQVVSNG